VVLTLFQGDIHIERERVKHVNSALQVDQLKPDTGVHVRESHVPTLMLVLGDTYPRLTRNKVDLRALPSFRAEERISSALPNRSSSNSFCRQFWMPPSTLSQYIHVGQLTVRTLWSSAIILEFWTMPPCDAGLRYPNFRPYADAYSAVVVVPARARITAISSHNGRGRQ
jgi:hypothetical protein